MRTLVLTIIAICAALALGPIAVFVGRRLAKSARDTMNEVEEEQRDDSTKHDS